MAGRVRSFSEGEIEVLRALARKLKADRGWSQDQLGKAIGISQQNAGRFVAAGSTAGMDRITANHLAVVCGYRDVEHALLEGGALAEMQPLPTGSDWRERDIALRIAAHLGYPPAIIEAVAHRYASPDYRHKPIRWWNDMIGMESVMNQATGVTETVKVPTPLLPPASTPVPSRVAAKKTGPVPKFKRPGVRSA